ncbi:hypothetical protein GCK32_005041 [Trichostrongylus colubriformis]|uniref:Uncharacterized protein n=1 Tax=Trichostrongylus colubriformis TaxID=6319 RepID=A0AAN8F3W3_TRICO
MMLAPQGPLQAEKLRPTLGNTHIHNSIRKTCGHRIPYSKTCNPQSSLVKCHKHRVTEVDSRVLYKKVPEERVINWTAAKPNQSS